jgi:hypothetical protein
MDLKELTIEEYFEQLSIKDVERGFPYHINYIARYIENATKLYNNIHPLIEEGASLINKICLNNQHLITPKQCIAGWGYLYRMIEYFNNPKIQLLDTSITYTVSPYGSKYSVTGILDPIIKQDDWYTTLIISFSDKLPESYYLNMNLKHTLDAYALNELIPNVQHSITYHSFRSCQERDTIRDFSSFKRLDTIINTVGYCIEQDLIYPRCSYNCNSCKMRGMCDKWIGGTIKRNGDGQFDTHL